MRVPMWADADPAVRWLSAYRLRWLPKDLVAGLVLTTLLVPQGMAYAALAGLPPITGLYTSILCLTAYALFGPSRILVLGPDSSLGPMIAATILPLVVADGDPQRAIALASMLALLTGAITTLAGIGKLGFVADLISKPTMIGYLNGLALTILVGQLPKLFGFSTDGTGFLAEVVAFARGVLTGQTVPAALAVGGLGLLMIVGLRRGRPKSPRGLGVGGLLVIAPGGLGLGGRGGALGGAMAEGVLSIIAASVLDLGERGVSLVGPMPQGFPPLTLPDIDLGDVVPLLIGAVGITVVSLADTIATSSAFAARAGQTVDGSREMIGIGTANIAAGLFQGFPVSTSGSRTAVAEQAGAKTQVTGLVGAVSITLILLLVPGMFRNLPQPTLAAVVIVASTALADVPGMFRLRRLRPTEFTLAVAAFVGVVALGVLPGIGIAVALSVGNVFRRAWWPYQTV